MSDHQEARAIEGVDAAAATGATAAAAPEPEIAADERLIDAEEMLRDEFAALFGGEDWHDKTLRLPDLIAQLHERSGAELPAALCLSGGGIRSATFSLGVLQWLAAKGRLREFSYLSTVSGGGYMGSFLVNGLRQAYLQAQEEEKQRNPGCTTADLEKVGRLGTWEWLHRLGQSSGTEYGARMAGAARITEGGHDPVAPLRAYSNYLSPTGGLSTDAFALAAIFLRNLLLNLLVWLPVLAVLVAVPRVYIATLTGGPALSPPTLDTAPLRSVADVLSLLGHWSPLLGALLAIIFGIGYVVADLPTSDMSTGAATGKRSWLRVLNMPLMPLLRRWTDKLPQGWQQRLPAVLKMTAEERRRQAKGQQPPAVPTDQFSLACFLPITGAAFVLSLLGAWMKPLHQGDLLWFGLAGAAAHAVGVVLGVWMRKARNIPLRPASWRGFAVVCIVGGVGGVLTWATLSLLGQGAVAAELSATQRLLYASFSVPALTGAFWLAMALHAGLTGRVSSEEDREWWARATAAWLKFTLVWVAAFGLLVWAPLLILDNAAEAGLTAVKFGMGGSALGVVTALVGYWSKHGDKVKSQAKGFIDATGLKLLDLMAGAVLVTLLLALSLTWNVVLDRCHGWRGMEVVCTVDMRAQTDLLREQARLSAAAATVTSSDAVRVLKAEPDSVSAELVELGSSAGAQVFAHVLLHGSGWALASAVLLLLALAVTLAFFMGANQFSLHGMYGNRLVRAYLGSGRPSRHPHWFTGFDPADNPKLAEFKAPLKDGEQPRLFPVINMALNLVKPSQKRLAWQQRKAASFFATPLHCGSAHLKFRSTARYAGGFTLGRAMTISGAAASPNMGYHSSPLVTAVMTLFNLRLGWWSPNPEVNRRWDVPQPALGLDIMLAEAGGATGDEDDYVYLSDGGHFDNTGIYEMVRRRCRRIVLVDATCDGQLKWGDLLDIVRKIRVDFGVPIKFDGELPGGANKPARPRRLTATIQYSERDPNIHDGKLIILKPMLLPGDPPDLAAYARDSLKKGSPPDDPARFPHQSTADQFFDEEQFESYRLLGWITADAALGPEPPPGQETRLEDKALEKFVAGVGSDYAEATKDKPALGGLGDLMQQMGSGMALATAITVGGTLGVAGTVALKPGEVSLSAEDRALLKQGGAPREGPAGQKGDTGAAGPSGKDGQASGPVPTSPTLDFADGVRARLDQGIEIKPTSDLQKTASDLATATGNLLRAVETLTKSGGTTLGVVNMSEIKDLTHAIRNVTASDQGEAKDLVTAINKLTSELKQVTEDKEPLQLKTRLDQLKSAIEKIAPRQNIRGQEGGQR